MKRAMIMAGGALVLAVGIGGGAYWIGVRDRNLAVLPLGQTAVVANPQGTDELRRIRAAEAIEDPLQRCLSYPDPHEFHWDHKVVEALCRRAQWKMISGQQIADALRDRHVDVIDAAFASYEKSNYADPERHGFLIWTYWWMFQGSSAWISKTTDNWVELAPRDAYALAARGIHRVQAAFDARGGRVALQTPQENFDRMRQLVGPARADLEAALALNPRLIVAYHGLLILSRLGEQKPERERWIKAALALDVADPWIWKDSLEAAQPQWGGSTMEMARIADQAASSAADNPVLATLKAAPVCNSADQYRCEDGCQRDGAAALDLYRQAGGFGPAECFLDGAGAAAALAEDSQTAARYYSQAFRFYGRPEWLAYRAPVLRSLGEDEWALADLQRARALSPRDTTALYSQGLTFERMGRLGDAETAYLEVLKIDPNDSRAAIALSIQYLWEGKPLYAPDKARPLVVGLIARDPSLAHAWQLKAALAWHDKDPAAYVVAGENYLRLVDHADAAKRSDIEAIEQRVAMARAAQQRTPTPSAQ